jgi:glycosyltransferase involved in cell wall biosynthesis
MDKMRKRIKVFSWHIHGSYLYYLSQGDFDIYVPLKENKSTGYIGRGTTFPFGNNVFEVPVDKVKELPLDCILFQTPQNYLHDQFEILSAEQRLLPKIYLEHDPPQGIPTDTPHVVLNDPEITLVHVTHFNKLMWNNGKAQTHVIDHGITPSSVKYSGVLDRGIVIINNLQERGRRLGLDIYLEVREHVPIDLIGMDTKKLGGLGEILHPQLPDFLKQYRFFFNPIRYTSLGLAVLEAMMVGLPVVGLATTEMVTVIQNGHNGILHTDISYLIGEMKKLIEDPAYAARLGNAGKQTVTERFNIQRFKSDWYELLSRVITGERFENSRLKSELSIY